jgi:hypothetical protein
MRIRIRELLVPGPGMAKCGSEKTLVKINPPVSTINVVDTAAKRDDAAPNTYF